MAGRIAPSPTGLLHIGSFRTFFFNYMFIKKRKEKFLLRIDDTDKKRSTLEFETALLEDLQEYGFKFDKIFKQSERQNIYDEYFEILKNKKKIYPVYETEEDLNDFRKQNKNPIFKYKNRFKFSGQEYWRFDLGNTPITITDIIRGKTTREIAWSDPIIKTSKGDYSYIFTSIIDDIVENITYIIRAEEHLANSYIQTAIANSLIDDFNILFAHIDLLLDTNGSKLSKRDNSFSLRDLNIFEKPAIFAYCFNLGNKNPIIDFFHLKTMDDWCNYFDFSNYNLKKQRFNIEDLKKYNKKYLSNIIYENPLYEILKHNVIYKNDFQQLENKINVFKEKDHWVWKKDFTLLTKQEKKQIQQDIFNAEDTPNILDILNFIKKEPKIH